MRNRIAAHCRFKGALMEDYGWEDADIVEIHSKLFGG